jgi:hypothetical protein
MLFRMAPRVGQWAREMNKETGVSPVSHTPPNLSGGRVSGIGGEMPKQLYGDVAVPEYDASLAGRLFGIGARLGTVGGGGFAIEKASGTPTGEAFKAAIIYTLFEASQLGGDFKGLVGKIFRMSRGTGEKTETANVTVEPDGSVKLLTDKVPPGAVDAEFNVDNVVEMKADAAGTYRAEGDTSPVRTPSEPAQLGEAPPKRIETPLPDAVQRIGLDSRAQKVGDVLADGQAQSPRDIAKSTRYNLAKVNETLELLYGAGKIEILPDNTVRLVEPLDKGVTSLYEQFNEKGKVSPEIPPTKTTSFEGAGDRGSADTQLVSRALQTIASGKQSLSSFDVPTQRMVMSDVIRALHDPQIRQSVIQTVPVDVVDMLRAQKAPTQILFHDKNVLSELTAINADNSVSIRVDIADALVRGVASSITKESVGGGGLTNAGKLGLDDIAAVGTVDSNSVSRPPHTDILPQNEWLNRVQKKLETLAPEQRAAILKDYPDDLSKLSEGQLKTVYNDIESPRTGLVEQPTVPKRPTKTKDEPRSLSQFIRAMGGVKPNRVDKGEIARLSNKDTGSTGLVTQNGRSIDDLAEAAAEAGFFQERPSPSELMQAIEDDATGHQKYFAKFGDADPNKDPVTGFDVEQQQMLAEAEKTRAVDVERRVSQLSPEVATHADKIASWLGDDQVKILLNKAENYPDGLSHEDLIQLRRRARSYGLKGDIARQHVDELAKHAEVRRVSQEAPASVDEGDRAGTDVSRESIYGDAYEPATGDTDFDPAELDVVSSREAEPELKRTVADLSPLERSTLRRDVAPKPHQGKGKLPSEAARAFGLPESELAKLPPLGEVGQFGQTSHLIKKTLSSEENDAIYNDFAKVFAPGEQRDLEPEFPEILDRGGQATNIVDAIALDMDYPRSSQMSPDVWGQFLDKHAERLGDDAINVILSALDHQERWHRNIIKFVTDPELEPLKKRVYELGDIAGLEGFANPKWGAITPPGFHENAPSFDFKDDSKLKKEALRIGRKYGIKESPGEGGLSDTAIKQTFLRAIRQAANEALETGTGKGTQRAADTADTPTRTAEEGARKEKELDIHFASTFDQTDLFGNKVTPQTEQANLFAMDAPVEAKGDLRNLDTKTAEYLQGFAVSSFKEVARAANAVIGSAKYARSPEAKKIIMDAIDALDTVSKARRIRTDLNSLLRQQDLSGKTVEEAISQRAKDFAYNIEAGTLGRHLDEELNGNIQFMTAWHGSPHKFDKFDISKIGTGEGAQAYGAGLYFTDKESVAEYYRNSLTSGLRAKPFLGGAVPSTANKGLTNLLWTSFKDLSHALVPDPNVTQTFSQLDVVERTRVLSMVRNLVNNPKVAEAVVRLVPVDVMDVLRAYKVTSEQLRHEPTMLVNLLPPDANYLIPSSVEAMDILAPIATVAAAKVFTGLPKFDISPSELDATKGTRKSIVNHINSKIPYPSEFINTGAKYRVDLKPDQDEYLLWDKPLSEQSEKVKKALMGNVVYSSEVKTYKLLLDDLDYLEKKGKLDTPEWDKKVAEVRQFRKDNPLVETFAHDNKGSDIYEGVMDRQDDEIRVDWVAERDHLMRTRGPSHPDTLAHLANNPNPLKLASDYLKSLGIRGIKYLDGSSRNASRTWVDGEIKKVQKVIDEREEILKGLQGRRDRVEGYGVKGQPNLDTKIDTAKTEIQMLQKKIEALEKDRPSYNYVIFDDADVEIQDIQFSKPSDAVVRGEKREARRMFAQVPDSMPDLIREAKFEATPGILNANNLSALKVAIEATKNIDLKRFGSASFSGAYYNRAATEGLQEVLDNAVNNALAAGQRTVARKLAEVAAAAEAATDPVHKDLIIVINDPKLPVMSRTSKQEELAHRNNQRSGAKAVFVEMSLDPGIQKALAHLGPGYAKISVANAVDEVIAKSFRDDAETELNLYGEEIDDHLNTLFNALEDANIDLAEYAKGVENVSTRGKQFAERANKRGEYDVEAQPRRTAESGVLARDTSGMRESRTDRGKGTRALDRNDVATRLRETDLSTASQGEALTRREERFIDRRAIGDAAQSLKADVMFSKPWGKVNINGELYDLNPRINKVRDVVLDVLSTPKAVKASTDLSAAGRQGLISAVNHPVIAGKAFAKQLTMLPPSYGERKYQEFKRDLDLHPFIELAEDAELHLTSLGDGSLARREEAFMSRLVGDDPYFKNKPLEGGRKLITFPVRASERAYVTFLDYVRINTFAKLARELHRYNERHGLGDDLESYKGLATWINNATGRGDLGRLNEAAPIFNALFFSPRYWASRLQVLNPVYYAKLPPGARKIALREMLSFVGAVAAVMAILKAAGAAIEADDPNSPDTLKIKIGDYSYDLSAGLVTHLRYIARMLKATQEKAPARQMTYLTERYGRSKLAPIPGAVYNTVEGKNFIGEKTTAKQEALGLITPIMADNFASAAKADGVEGVIRMSPEFFGIGVTQKKKR